MSSKNNFDDQIMSFLFFEWMNENVMMKIAVIMDKAESKKY